MNNGSGSFSGSTTMAGANAAGIAVADLNRDGWPDVTVAKVASLEVWLNNHDGTFSISRSYVQPTSLLRGIDTADFDFDGNPDIVVVDEAFDQVRVFPGVGDGTLGTPESFATGNEPKAVIADDWNADNAPDIAAPYRNGGETPFVSVLFQQAIVGIPPAGQLLFSQTSYSAVENEVGVTFAVVRVGGSTGTVSVDYNTTDVTATTGLDYTAQQVH